MSDPAPERQPTPSAPSNDTPPSKDKAAKKAERNITVGQILAGILLVLIIIFIVENTDDVKIRIIAGPKVTTPVFVALLIAAVVGALIAGLMRARRKHNAKKRS